MDKLWLIALVFSSVLLFSGCVTEKQEDNIRSNPNFDKMKEWAIKQDLDILHYRNSREYVEEKIVLAYSKHILGRELFFCDKHNFVDVVPCLDYELKLIHKFNAVEGVNSVKIVERKSNNYRGFFVDFEGYALYGWLNNLTYIDKEHCGLNE